MKAILKTCACLTILFSITHLAPAQASQEAQQPCTQKLTNLPAVRGLKHGMSLSELLKIYPLASVTKKDEIGLQTVRINHLTVVDKELKRNLKSIYGDFIDDKLQTFAILYDDSIKWGSLSKFVEPLAETFNIPTQVWSLELNILAMAKCSDFQLTAALLPQESAIIMQPKDYEKNRDQLRKDIEEKKRKSFKP